MSSDVKARASATGGVNPDLHEWAKPKSFHNPRRKRDPFGLRSDVQIQNQLPMNKIDGSLA